MFVTCASFGKVFPQAEGQWQIPNKVLEDACFMSMAEAFEMLTRRWRGLEEQGRQRETSLLDHETRLFTCHQHLIAGLAYVASQVRRSRERLLCVSWEAAWRVELELR